MAREELASGAYRCAACGRELADLDDVCNCGNAVGVLNL